MWALRFGDHRWTENDVVVGDVLVVGELLQRDDWQVVDPASSPRATVAWLSVFLARELDVPVEHAQLLVVRSPFAVLADALDTAPDDEAPAAPPPAPPAGGGPAGDREPLLPRPQAPGGFVYGSGSATTGTSAAIAYV